MGVNVTRQCSLDKAPVGSFHNLKASESRLTSGRSAIAKVMLITEDRATDVQRVLIIENQLLLGAGVQSLLAGEADLDVIGISPVNQAELVQEIRRFRPDVVVLDEVTHLADATRLMTFLKNHPKLRVVVVSANDNLVCIYNKQQVLVRQATDLINLIRDS
jgi:stage III sporulation protein SpoIIIAA